MLVSDCSKNNETLKPESLFDAQLSERLVSLSIVDNEENNIAGQEILLYPNPATNLITINSKLEITQIEVYNTIGKLLYQEKLDSFKTTFNLSDYPNGNYFIKIKTEKSQKNFKVIKK